MKNRWRIGLILGMLFPGILWAQPTDAMVKQPLATVLSDGVRLASDLYLPSRENAWPTILIRTPYGKWQFQTMAESWARSGYAVVVQDTRGKFESEGTYQPLLHEREDGGQTLSWIAKQPWCDGKIGMWGSSYLAYCALVLAAEGHPQLRSVFNISGYIHGNRLGHFDGVNHLLLNIPWLIHVATEQNQPLKDFDLEALFRYLPLKDALGSIGVHNEIWDRPEKFLRLNEDLSAANIDIPIFHVTGWMDFVRDAALEIYQQTAHSNQPRRLLVGPWHHDQYYTRNTSAGDEDFGPASALGMQKLIDLSRRWFDQTLKGEKGEGLQEPPVQLFLMGANRWWRGDHWPPKAARPRAWFLDSETGANTVNGDGRLVDQPARELGKDRFRYDPMNPAPSLGGANFHFFGDLLGIRDQREIEKREDVLVYTSQSFERDLLLVGPVSARVFVATDGENADVTAKLVLVREDGYAGIITEGISRLYAPGFQKDAQPAKPGKVYEVRVKMGHTALVIQKGQRLRLEISGSNFPKYDRNPGTKAHPFLATSLQSTNQEIFLGRKFPTSLEALVMEP